MQSMFAWLNYHQLLGFETPFFPGIWTVQWSILIVEGHLMIRSCRSLSNTSVPIWESYVLYKFPHLSVRWEILLTKHQWTRWNVLNILEHCQTSLGCLRCAIRFLNGFLQQMSRSRNHVIPSPEYWVFPRALWIVLGLSFLQFKLITNCWC